MEGISVIEHKRIDELEAVLFAYPQVICPLAHLFTPGLYVRKMLIPAGTMLTSAIHKTTHPYHVSKGKINIDVDGVITKITAPYDGVTESGTRRVGFALEDCEWTTYHVLPMITGEENLWDEEEKNKLISRIWDMIIEEHDNPLLCPEVKTYLTEKKETQCQQQ